MYVIINNLFLIDNIGVNVIHITIKLSFYFSTLNFNFQKNEPIQKKPTFPSSFDINKITEIKNPQKKTLMIMFSNTPIFAI